MAKRRVKAAAQDENSQRQAIDLNTGSKGSVPAPNAALAMVFAKMVTVGVAPALAIRSMFPEFADEHDLCVEFGRQWMLDAEVQRAIDGLNGGAWADLPKDKRIQLAYEKHVGEAAYLLWSGSFIGAETRDDIEKFKQARELLKAELGKATDETDPMQAFARFALELGQQMAAQAKQRKVIGIRHDSGMPAEPTH